MLFNGYLLDPLLLAVMTTVRVRFPLRAHLARHLTWTVPMSAPRSRALTEND